MSAITREEKIQALAILIASQRKQLNPTPDDPLQTLLQAREVLDQIEPETEIEALKNIRPTDSMDRSPAWLKGAKRTPLPPDFKSVK